MYDCLVCYNDSEECEHYSYAALGNLFCNARVFVNSWTWNDLFSVLAQRQLVLGELCIGHSKGNYLLTLTAKGKRFVLANMSKVVNELAEGNHLDHKGSWLFDKDKFCTELIGQYATLAALPQFLTSDNEFLRSIAEKRFRDLEAELNLQEKDHIG